MDAREFSDQFDVLYNNITSNQAPGLDEYEKSVFLTKAQEEIIKNYFNPKANPKGEGFDDSPKRQADFSTLIRVGDMVPTTSTQFDRRNTTRVFNYPNTNVFLVLNEQVRDSKYDYVVKPISYEEYDRLMSKPYKYPPKYQAWRLITEVTNTTTSRTEIVPDTNTIVFSKTVGASTVTAYTLSFATVYNNTKETNITIEYDEYSGISSNYSSTVTEETDSYNISITLKGQITFVELKNYLQYDTEVIPLVSVEGSGDSGGTAIGAFFGTSDPYINNVTLTPTTKTITVTKGTPTIELIGRFSDNLTYTVRYVKKPYPIILEDFTSTNVSIEGVSTPGNPVCELPEQLHEEILQRAVELAKIAWTATGQDNVQTVIQAGQRSE